MLIMSWVEIASAAYSAYIVSCDNKNYRGEPCPTWDELPEATRRHWVAASQKVAELVSQN